MSEVPCSDVFGFEVRPVPFSKPVRACEAFGVQISDDRRVFVPQGDSTRPIQREHAENVPSFAVAVSGAC